MSQRDVTGWLPNLLGPTDFQVGGAPQSVPKRSIVNLLGGVTVTDNPSNDSTDITFTAAGGGGLEVVDITAPAYGGNGDGTTDNTASMNLAIDALAANGVVYFPPGTYRFSSTQSWAANVWFGHGAALTIDSTKTVTIEGMIDANEYQNLFKGSGNVVIESSSKISVCWFGADPTNTVTSAAQIRKALAAAKVAVRSNVFGTLITPVFAPAGIYDLEKPLALNANFQDFSAAGFNATSFSARTYVGPAINTSNTPLFTTHAADFGSLNSVTVGDAPALL